MADETDEYGYPKGQNRPTPAPDQQRARDFSAGARQSGSISDGWANIKKAVSGAFGGGGSNDQIDAMKRRMNGG